MSQKRKLIEVALPLDAINTAAATEKSIRKGHPSTLHLWWARRPLAACRAVLFASLVDDPSCDVSLTLGEQEVRRKELFELLERLVQWTNSNNSALLDEARQEIMKSIGGGGGETCRRCWIRSLAGGRSRWRRSDWAWRPMPGT